MERGHWAHHKQGAGAEGGGRDPPNLCWIQGSLIVLVQKGHQGGGAVSSLGRCQQHQRLTTPLPHRMGPGTLWPAACSPAAETLSAPSSCSGTGPPLLCSFPGAFSSAPLPRPAVRAESHWSEHRGPKSQLPSNSAGWTSPLLGTEAGTQVPCGVDTQPGHSRTSGGRWTHSLAAAGVWWGGGDEQ